MKEAGLTRIVVVDDNLPYRDALAQILGGWLDFKVVGLGGNADDALRLASQVAPDVLLLDLNMPGGGLDAARRLARCCPGVDVLVLTSSNDPLDRAEAGLAGVRLYLLKGISSNELAEAIRFRGAG